MEITHLNIFPLYLPRSNFSQPTASCSLSRYWYPCELQHLLTFGSTDAFQAVHLCHGEPPLKPLHHYQCSSQVQASQSMHTDNMCQVSKILFFCPLCSYTVILRMKPNNNLARNSPNAWRMQ